ncbi:MAG: STAS domain-containing protein [Actinomycetota bacterium]
MSDEAVRVELTDGLQGAKLSGELDIAVYEKLTAELAPLFEATGDLILDLSDVAFVDSSTIRLFVRLQQSRKDTGSVVLLRPQPHVARVLAVSGVGELGMRVQDQT